MFSLTKPFAWLFNKLSIRLMKFKNWFNRVAQPHFVQQNSRLLEI
ncbi:protein of unknown function [Xenorhabdus nematophila AN6/1]|nr:protein of unknown function [Xenorhabdus nematophila AN6/1]